MQNESEKIKVLEEKISYLEKINENYKKQVKDLEEKLKAASGGRPKKFTDQDRETMKMYRLQGKPIRYIAKDFTCSTGLVHKIVSEE